MSPSYWLLLADPKSYKYDDLEKEKRTVWDGIAGSIAQKHMRSFQKGDEALIYHTAPDKAVVGVGRIVSNPYPDPKDAEAKLVVVDIEPVRRLKTPVSLQQLRENKKLAGMTFLKIQRIAVSPLSQTEFDEILKMGGSTY
jgi:predicted RNA-binding protein with PUA-like domain